MLWCTVPGTAYFLTSGSVEVRTSVPPADDPDLPPRLGVEDRPSAVPLARVLALSPGTHHVLSYLGASVLRARAALGVGHVVYLDFLQLIGRRPAGGLEVPGFENKCQRVKQVDRKSTAHTNAPIPTTVRSTPEVSS